VATITSETVLNQVTDLPADFEFDVAVVTITTSSVLWVKFSQRRAGLSRGRN
jgi:hypothetical protein